MNDALHTFVREMEAQQRYLNFVQVSHLGNVIEEYSRLSRHARLHVYSIAKSITSVAVGIAVDDGLFELDDLVCDFFKEEIPDSASGNLLKVRVRHLLTMTSGISDSDMAWDGDSRKETSDWLGFFFSRQFNTEPGSQFHYASICTYVLGRIIEQRTGKTLHDFCNSRIFIPLGIENPDWLNCPHGHTMGGYGLSLSIDELTRFGELLINEGSYRGHRIVSAKYLRSATTRQVISHTPQSESDGRFFTAGYGFGFWINPDGSYRAEGMFSQILAILPEIKATIAIQALDENAPEILEAAWSTIVDSLKSVPTTISQHSL
ncbi:serine hydrolase [Arthrobacter sp. EpRS71]|uniref:serine hydrolase domain-containing protein n=1 Tax=Arthrobacter sp. EpRS71 TaxID=1743141 RepID=UPI000746BD30|nr:serine hydrolase [Arthrobacter sp. EpRS71]KUM36347.1 hypothetical protein AR689_20665 [Arthrobacter sp. EpRS71]